MRGSEVGYEVGDVLGGKDVAEGRHGLAAVVDLVGYLERVHAAAEVFEVGAAVSAAASGAVAVGTAVGGEEGGSVDGGGGRGGGGGEGVREEEGCGE